VQDSPGQQAAPQLGAELIPHPGRRSWRHPRSPPAAAQSRPEAIPWAGEGERGGQL